MKKYVLFPALALLAFCWSSCCKKEACIEVEGIPVRFLGYKATDLDTIYTTGYAPGTGFGNITRFELLDTVQNDYASDTTFILKVRGSSGVTMGGVAGGALTDEHEWKIYIPALKQTIFIGTYGYHTYTCNSCGLSKGREIRSLSTCAVNGTIVKVDAVIIYK